MRQRPAQERPKSGNPREMVPQRAPKMDLKSIKMGIKIEVGFCIDFSSIFYRFLKDFGYQNGVKNRLQKCVKISTGIQLKFVKKALENRLAQKCAISISLEKTNIKINFLQNTQNKKTDRHVQKND